LALDEVGLRVSAGNIPLLTRRATSRAAMLTRGRRRKYFR
jgi:hypothetical protein